MPDARPPWRGGDWLFVRASEAGGEPGDFLSVIDARPGSPTYANVVATAQAGAAGTNEGHVEHRMPDGVVFSRPGR